MGFKEIIKKRGESEGEKEGDKEAIEILEKNIKKEHEGDPDWKKRAEEKKRKLYELPSKEN